MNPEPALASGDEPVLGHLGLVAVLLIAFAAATCLAGLGAGPALGDHECINALAARHSLQSGEFIIPRYGGDPWIRKTPLGIWLIMASSRLIDMPGHVPVSDVAARLPSALAAFANVLVVSWLARMMFGARAGLVAGFISAGCLTTVLYGRNAQVDVLLALLTTLSYACFWRGAVHEPRSRKAMIAFYVVFFLAMMAKAPMPVVTVAVPLAAYWLLTLPWERARGPGGGGARIRRFRDAVVAQLRSLGVLWFLPGTALFLVLFAAWPIYVCTQIPLTNVLNLWKLEYLARFFGGLADKREPFFAYIPFVFGLTLPFALSISEAVAAPFLRRYEGHRRGLAFAWAWAVVATLVLSASSFKQPHYLLSVMPAYCLLLAPVIDRLFFGEVSAGPRLVRAACLVVAGVVVVSLITAVVLLRWKFPHAGLAGLTACIAPVLIGAWGISAWQYARGRRTISFALLNLGTLAAFLLAWPMLGQHLGPKPELKALADGLRKHEVGTGDRIYWVEGRQDASLEFYSGYPVRRLIDEIELAAWRKDRVNVSVALLERYGERIKEYLARPEPVYLIMESGNLALLRRNMDIHPRVLFELDGFHDEPGEELAVITQETGGESATK